MHRAPKRKESAVRAALPLPAPLPRNESLLFQNSGLNGLRKPEAVNIFRMLLTATKECVFCPVFFFFSSETQRTLNTT